MNKSSLPPILMVCCIFLSTIISVSAQGELLFNHSIERARTEASQSGKLYLVYFTAEWLMPAQWMEENTFHDIDLLTYLTKSYLTVKVDVDDLNSKALQKQYEVTSLPAFFVFSSRGQLLGQLDGALEAEQLIEWLKTYDLPSNKTQTVAIDEPAEHILSSPKAVIRVSRPALIPTSTASYNLKPVINTPSNYHYNAQRPSANYYGIQIGLFSSYENALREVKVLERKLNCPTHFVKDKVGNTTYYRILVGRLESRHEAIQLQHRLKSQGVEGFVKKMTR
jgi:thioredoxin-related protein